MKKLLYLIPGYLLMLFQVGFAQPAREWVSYYAGTLTNMCKVHYDEVGNCIYVAGTTQDLSEIATPGSFKETHIPGSTDVFLAKFDLDGNRIWATYFGGEGEEDDLFMKTDRSGNVYLAGRTMSITGISTPGAHQEFNNNAHTHFLTKFSPDGERLWSTYYGIQDTVTLGSTIWLGSPGCYAISFDFDEMNNIYLAGGTETSSGIATPGAYKEVANTPDTFYISGISVLLKSDAFLVKFDSNGVRQWGTYYGGKNQDAAEHVVYDNGYVYITGYTYSDTGIGSPGAYQEYFATDTFPYASFLAKFSISGELVWSTYIAGTSNTKAINMDVDLQHNLYLYGYTTSGTHIATAGVYQEHINGDRDVFVMKFSADGNKLWGTYVGGEGDDFIHHGIPYYFPFGRASNFSIVSTFRGGAYICGYTDGSDGLATRCSYRTNLHKRGFIASLDKDGGLNWASHYDATVQDISIKENADGIADIFFVGRTNINGLTTPGAFKESKLPPSGSGLIARFKDEVDCGRDTLRFLWEASLLTADSGYESYQWYHNGMAIAGASGEAYDPGTDTAGYYYVTAERCGCTYMSDTFYFDPTSLPDVKSAYQSLSVYPNPVGDEVNILLKDISVMKGQLTITDILGREVYISTFENNGSGIYTIDISSYPQGIYYIRLTIGENQYLGKIVKK